jgi:hypothetical protein
VIGIDVRGRAGRTSPMRFVMHHVLLARCLVLGMGLPSPGLAASAVILPRRRARKTSAYWACSFRHSSGRRVHDEDDRGWHRRGIKRWARKARGRPARACAQGRRSLHGQRAWPQSSARDVIIGAPLPSSTSSNFANLIDHRTVGAVETFTGAFPAESCTKVLGIGAATGYAGVPNHRMNAC